MNKGNTTSTSTEAQMCLQMTNKLLSPWVRIVELGWQPGPPFIQSNPSKFKWWMRFLAAVRHQMASRWADDTDDEAFWSLVLQLLSCCSWWWCTNVCKVCKCAYNNISPAAASPQPLVLLLQEVDSFQEPPLGVTGDSWMHVGGAHCSHHHRTVNNTMCNRQKYRETIPIA